MGWEAVWGEVSRKRRWLTRQGGSNFLPLDNDARKGSSLGAASHRQSKQKENRCKNSDFDTLDGRKDTRRFETWNEWLKVTGIFIELRYLAGCTFSWCPEARNILRPRCKEGASPQKVQPARAGKEDGNDAAQCSIEICPLIE